MNSIQRLLNDLNNSPFPVPTSLNIPIMNCQYYNCDKLATFGFRGCFPAHGQTIRMLTEQLPDLFDADKNEPMREVISVGEVNHYSKIV